MKRVAVSFVAALCWVIANTALHAEEFAASLEASVSLERFDGTRIEEARTGEGFVISVRLKDVVTGQPFIPKEGLQAWIRIVAKSNSPCRQAVRNYRAAEGRLPIGALDLNGTLLANLTRENNLHVLSPKLDLAQANILSSTILPEKPAAILQHPLSRSLLFSLPKAGKVMQLRPFEKHPSVFAEGLQSPGLMAVADAGGIWIEEIDKSRIVLLDQSGQQIKTVETNAPLSKLLASQRTLLAVSKTGALNVAEAKSGAPLLAFQGKWKDAALFDDGKSRHLALLDIQGDAIWLRYLDGQAPSKPVKLAAQSSEVALSPDGRWAFAFDANHQAVSVVDMAAGALATALAFKSGVAEVVFSADTVYFRLTNNSGIASLQSASLGQGRSPSVSFHDFGVPGSQATPGEVLLLPLTDSGFVIAVQSGSEAGFVVNGKTQQSRALPQTGIRFRGGAPFRIIALENGFTSTPDGALRAAAMLDRSGAHELVLSTGLQGLTSCIAFNVNGESKEQLPRDVRFTHVNTEQAIYAGRDVTMTFALQDEKGEIAFTTNPALRFVLLNGGWRKTVQAQSIGTHAVIRASLPLPGTYIVQPLGLGPSFTLRSTTEIKVLP